MYRRADGICARRHVPDNSDSNLREFLMSAARGRVGREDAIIRSARDIADSGGGGACGARILDGAAGHVHRRSTPLNTRIWKPSRWRTPDGIQAAREVFLYRTGPYVVRALEGSGARDTLARLRDWPHGHTGPEPV